MGRETCTTRNCSTADGSGRDGYAYGTHIRLGEKSDLSFISRHRPEPDRSAVIRQVTSDRSYTISFGLAGHGPITLLSAVVPT